MPLRLLFGPSARIRCAGSRLLPGEPPAPAARVILTR
jgi:hypothetical protein